MTLRTSLQFDAGEFLPQNGQTLQYSEALGGWVLGTGSASGVSSLNGLTGALTLLEGTDIGIVASGDGITLTNLSPGATPASSVVGPDAYGASPAVGTSLDYARADHDHGLPAAQAGTPATSVTGPDAYGASAVVGTSTNYARQDHDHGLPSEFTSPASTVVGPDAYGASAVVGVSTDFARADHDHGLPAAPTTSGSVILGFATPATYGTLTQTDINNAVTGGYAGIYLDPLTNWTVSSKLVIGGGSNYPFVLKSFMYGGAGYGDKDTPPFHYIDLTMSTGDGIQIPDNAAKVRFEGIGIIGTVTGACVHINGARMSGTSECYIKNESTAAGSYALVIDTSTGGADAEDNYFRGCYFKGGYGALGIGLNDSTFHSNDCLWDAITTSGGTYGVNHQAGGNHTFINWYDRSNPSATCFLSNSICTVFGGEDRNTTTGGTALTVTGGECWWYKRSVTQAGATTDISVTGGTLYLGGIRSNSMKLLQTAGSVVIGRDCYVNNGSYVCNGGTIYYPTVMPNNSAMPPTGSGTITSY